MEAAFFGRSLAHLVDKHVSHGRKMRILLEHAQEHARRTKEQARVGTLPRLATYGVTDGAAAHTLAPLRGDPIRHTDRGDASWLRDDNVDARAPLRRRLEHKLGHLSRLARARLSFDDARWLRQCRKKLGARVGNGKALANRSTRPTAGHYPRWWRQRAAARSGRRRSASRRGSSVLRDLRTLRSLCSGGGRYSLGLVQKCQRVVRRRATARGCAQQRGARCCGSSQGLRNLRLHLRSDVNAS